MGSSTPVSEPVSFGEAHFGAAQLGDKRLTRRLVHTADCLARHPGGTLPEKLHSPADLQGTYRLMDSSKVTHASILAPHHQRTLERMAALRRTVLVLHDSTELNFTTHHSLKDDLGQIGNGSRRGYICHNSLAVDPKTHDVLGLTGQILHRRAAVGKGEKQTHSRERKDRESRLWVEGVRELPPDRNFVDVCDRGADTFEFLEHECASQRRFVIRSAYNRGVHQGHEPSSPRGYLHDFARTLPSLGSHVKAVQPRQAIKRPKKTGRKKVVSRTGRDAELLVSAGAALVRAPDSKYGEHGDDPLAVWVVRVWEPQPPAGEQPLEWFLLTNHPVESYEDAAAVVGWYERRWIIEEYHKAQKTGCGIENPQFTTVDRLQPMLALLSVVALTLLNLREQSRRPDAKHRPAADLVSEEYIAILSAWRHRSPRPDWSVHEFFLALARLGGHQNRKHDHYPGWLVLWRGWTRLQAMLDGARAIESIRRCA